MLCNVVVECSPPSPENSTIMVEDVFSNTRDRLRADAKSWRACSDTSRSYHWHPLYSPRQSCYLGVKSSTVTALVQLFLKACPHQLKAVAHSAVAVRPTIKIIDKTLELHLSRGIYMELVAPDQRGAENQRDLTETLFRISLPRAATADQTGQLCRCAAYDIIATSSTHHSRSASTRQPRPPAR